MDALDALDFTLWLYAAQAVAGVALGLIFAGYHRAFGSSYLACWSGSFFALGIYAASSAASILMIGASAQAPVRIGLALFAQAASYLQIVLLGLGTLGVLRGRHWTRRELSIAGALAIAFGFACALAFIGEPAPALKRLFVRVGLHHATLAITCGVLAALLLREGAWNRTLGLRATVIALGLYAVEQMHVFTVFLSQMLLGASVPWAPFLGIVDLVCVVFAGLALLIWLLDEERARADAALRRAEHLERFDPLTGLSNERQFRERLQAMCARARVDSLRAGVLVIELDRFELVVGASRRTQVHEHALIAVAARLQRLLPDPPTPRPARLQGHRFAIALPLFEEPAFAERFGQSIQAVLAEPLDVGTVAGRGLPLTASIGVAVTPDDGVDAEALLRAAQLALQQARADGGGRAVRYDPELKTRAQLKLALEAELRRAFAQQQFVLFYQPLVRQRDLRVEGFEALVRWQHPERGLQSPAAFLGAIEDMGLMADLDLYVLRVATRQVAAWSIECGAPVRIAVNVTAHSFRRPEFAREVMDAVIAAGIAPDQLELELTESTALADVDLAVRLLEELRALGVRAALDDFGTGYSSLSQLRRLPVTRIKIDRSFIADPSNLKRDGALVKGLVSLAHGLDLEVLVEGVETEEQLRFCGKAGCELLQGYYFAPPLPAESCARLVEQIGRSAAIRALA